MTVSQSVGDRLDAIIDELSELQVDVARTATDLEHEPGELDAIEERVRTMNQLQRKYGETLAEVLEFGAEAESGPVSSPSCSAPQIGSMTSSPPRQSRAVQAATVLSESRRRAATSLEKRTVAHLEGAGDDGSAGANSISQMASSGLKELIGFSFSLRPTPASPRQRLRRSPRVVS